MLNPTRTAKQHPTTAPPFVIPMTAPGPVMSGSPTSFQIALVKQTSLAEETTSKNGLTIPHHVVVKGAPFFVTLRMIYDNQQPAFRYPITFHNLALEVSLLYDCDTLKEVAFLKNKPVTFKPSINEDGTEVTCQCRLKVLTSQHEGSFFRIRFRAKPPAVGSKQAQGLPACPIIDVLSSPYKVISKPEQLKARQQQAKGISTTNSAGKKRNLSEMLYDTIARLEKQQQEHQKMLEHLIGAGVLPQEFLSFEAFSSRPGQTSPTTTTTTTTTTTGHFMKGEKPEVPHLDVQKELELAGLFDLPPLDEKKGEEEETATTTTSATKDKAQDKKKEEDSESFENLFLRCMKAYAAVDADQRPTKIRRVMRNATTKQTDEVREFADLLYSEGLGRNMGGVDFLSAFGTGGSSNALSINSLTSLFGTGNNNPHTGGDPTHNHGSPSSSNGSPASSSGEGVCTCSNCPHKMELEKIDQFYSEFLN